MTNHNTNTGNCLNNLLCYEIVCDGKVYAGPVTTDPTGIFEYIIENVGDWTRHGGVDFLRDFKQFKYDHALKIHEARIDPKVRVWLMDTIAEDLFEPHNIELITRDFQVEIYVSKKYV